MIGWMLKRMIYYVALMLVVLMSYGVFRQSVLFPHEEFNWNLVRDVFFKPYFMIYGELFADDIDPPCGNGTKPDGSFDPEMPPCETGRWLNPLLMTAYLLVLNILLLNLLIAVFNAIFLKTNVYSHEIWKFNRFAVVMEYDQKPALPPPFIVISHFRLVVRWCQRRCAGSLNLILKIHFLVLNFIFFFGFIGVKDSFDCGLKLFLDKDDLERLYDFEEESMEGLARERETKQNQTMEERVRLIGNRLDGLGLRVDGHRHRDISQMLNSLESRLTLLEKAIEQTTHACYSIVHSCATPHQSITETSTTTLSEATTVLANALDSDKWPMESATEDEFYKESECRLTDGAVLDDLPISLEEDQEETTIARCSSIRRTPNQSNLNVCGVEEREKCSPKLRLSCSVNFTQRPQVEYKS